MEVVMTVKAYPTVSTKYGEAVCVAAVRVDVEPYEWVRFFPVGFRDLPKHQRFHKYQHVRLRARKGSSDRRKETWKPDLGSIELGDVIPAGGAWTARRELLEPLVGPTMCELHRGRKGGGDGPSLGLVRPALVRGVAVSPEDEWSIGQRATVGQGNLLTKKVDLVKPDHAFFYSYVCEEPGCNGHRQKIVDWELGEAYRKWPESGDALIEAIRSRWHNDMCAEHREPSFFVGDQYTRPGQFLVLGTFYPEHAPAESQLSLALA
jgi:hypothetical protein